MKAKIELEFEMTDINDYDWDYGSNMDVLVKELLRQTLEEAVKEQIKKDKNVKLISSKLKKEFLDSVKEKLSI